LATPSIGLYRVLVQVQHMNTKQVYCFAFGELPWF
jgi:hypothetical protein